jgi:hypothetical protein
MAPLASATAANLPLSRKARLDDEHGIRKLSEHAFWVWIAVDTPTPWQHRGELNERLESVNLLKQDASAGFHRRQVLRMGPSDPPGIAKPLP